MLRQLLLVAAFLAAPALAQGQTPDTLKKIRDSKTVSIAYRTDAFPFSFENNGQPAGYSVDLCKHIVTSLEQQLKVQPLTVKWVPATSQNRMDLVRKGQAEMECGSTTATLGRMEVVDFSSPIFVDTTGILSRKASGASTFDALSGKKVGVIAGTTNQRALENALKKRLVSANVVTFKSRDEALAALEAASIDAFVSDKLLLAGLGGKVKDPTQYEILAEDLSFEPYAIVLPRGDASFRLAVNRGLSQVYGSEAIADVFRRNFGANIQPSPALLVMYGLNNFSE